MKRKTVRRSKAGKLYDGQMNTDQTNLLNISDDEDDE